MASAMTGNAPVEWTPPLHLGPIPVELEGRARLLLDAQTEAAGMISEAKAQTVKHIHAIDLIPEPQGRSRLAFLDVTG